MVGPSSSHTAGAVRLGLVARSLFGEQPEEVTIILYGSFGEVYDGHGTDTALIAGLLGMYSNDTRIKKSFDIGKEQGMKIKMIPRPDAGKRYHPNTAKFYMKAGDREMMVLGSSVGGGNIEIVRIDDMNVSFNAEHDLLIFTAEKSLNVFPPLFNILKEHPGVQMQQFFSHEKRRNSDYNRYLVELTELPADAVARLAAEPGITRVSPVERVNQWAHIESQLIPEL